MKNNHKHWEETIRAVVSQVSNLHISADNRLPIVRVRKCYLCLSRIIWQQSSNLLSFLPIRMWTMPWNIPMFLTMIPFSSSTWAWVSITLSRPLFSEWCFCKKIRFNLWYLDNIYNEEAKRKWMELTNAIKLCLLI